MAHRGLKRFANKLARMRGSLKTKDGKAILINRTRVTKEFGGQKVDGIVKDFDAHTRLYTVHFENNLVKHL